MEIVTIACHDLAAILFQQSDGGCHKGCHTWKPEPIITTSFGSSDSIYSPSPDPTPTVFYHTSYRAFDQYPNGVADIVGYWAESQLFGGVVVFDRGEEDTGVRNTS